MSHDTTDLIVELTIVGILFVVLIVTMTLLTLKGQGDCKVRPWTLRPQQYYYELALAVLLSDNSPLTPVVQTPKLSVTRVQAGIACLSYRAQYR